MTAPGLTGKGLGTDRADPFQMGPPPPSNRGPSNVLHTSLGPVALHTPGTRGRRGGRGRTGGVANELEVLRGLSFARDYTRRGHTKLFDKSFSNPRRSLIRASFGGRRKIPKEVAPESTICLWGQGMANFDTDAVVIRGPALWVWGYSTRVLVPRTA